MLLFRQRKPNPYDFCRILIDRAEDGAAISFMTTLTRAEAESFWLKDVKSSVESGKWRLLGAFVDERLIGTV